MLHFLECNWNNSLWTMSQDHASESQMLMTSERGRFINRTTGLKSIRRSRFNGWYVKNETNFMALLTVSKESALAEAGNSVLSSSVFSGLAGNFGLCACILHVAKHSTLTLLAQKFGACMLTENGDCKRRIRR